MPDMALRSRLRRKIGTALLYGSAIGRTGTRRPSSILIARLTARTSLRWIISLGWITWHPPSTLTPRRAELAALRHGDQDRIGSPRGRSFRVSAWRPPGRTAVWGFQLGKLSNPPGQMAE